MARIVTVYNAWRQPFAPIEMGYIRWLKMSEALARLGHQVDIATNEPTWRRGWRRGQTEVRLGPNLRRVPVDRVRWDDYELVKTLFHEGFATLERFDGLGHPLIVSKLGSVVGPRDMDGIPFYGRIRERLYSIQERIARTSSHVTVISDPARELWESCFGDRPSVLVVPGAADRDIPPAAQDPFPPTKAKRCLFAGNIYFRHSQPEANLVLVDKLNRLGQLLDRRGIHLYVVGTGDVSRLDRQHVRYLGAVPYDESWQYLYFADVGVVLAAAGFLHNNESTKIYHYLRAGLPTVSEGGFPNDNVILDAGLGLVSENGNLEMLADAVAAAANRCWDRGSAVRYVLAHHTWDQRAAVYDQLLEDTAPLRAAHV